MAGQAVQCIGGGCQKVKIATLQAGPRREVGNAGKRSFLAVDRNTLGHRPGKPADFAQAEAHRTTGVDPAVPVAGIGFW